MAIPSIMGVILVGVVSIMVFSFVAKETYQGAGLKKIVTDHIRDRGHKTPLVQTPSAPSHIPVIEVGEGTSIGLGELCEKTASHSHAEGTPVTVKLPSMFVSGRFLIKELEVWNVYEATAVCIKRYFGPNEPDNWHSLLTSPTAAQCEGSEFLAIPIVDCGLVSDGRASKLVKVFVPVFSQRLYIDQTGQQVLSIGGKEIPIDVKKPESSGAFDRFCYQIKIEEKMTTLHGSLADDKYLYLPSLGLPLVIMRRTSDGCHLTDVMQQVCITEGAEENVDDAKDVILDLISQTKIDMLASENENTSALMTFCKECASGHSLSIRFNFYCENSHLYPVGLHDEVTVAYFSGGYIRTDRFVYDPLLGVFIPDIWETVILTYGAEPKRLYVNDKGGLKTCVVKKLENPYISLENCTYTDNAYSRKFRVPEDYLHDYVRSDVSQLGTRVKSTVSHKFSGFSMLSIWIILLSIILMSMIGMWIGFSIYKARRSSSANKGYHFVPMSKLTHKTERF